MKLWAMLALGLAVGWNGPKAMTQLGGVCAPSTQFCLGTASVVEQQTARPDGGPQALEGYTLVNHPTGTVKLASGTIGNLEIAGAGSTTEAHSMASGIVVSGPGTVAHASTLTLSAPQRMQGYEGPVNVQSFDYITFSNGWRIRPNGSDLEICDQFNRCRGM